MHVGAVKDRLLLQKKRLGTTDEQIKDKANATEGTPTRKHMTNWL